MVVYWQGERELNLEFTGVLPAHKRNTLSLNKLYKREASIRLLLSLPQKAIDEGTGYAVCCGHLNLRMFLLSQLIQQSVLHQRLPLNSSTIAFSQKFNDIHTFAYEGMQNISGFVMDFGLQFQYLIHASPVFRTVCKLKTYRFQCHLPWKMNTFMLEVPTYLCVRCLWSGFVWTSSIVSLASGKMSLVEIGFFSGRGFFWCEGVLKWGGDWFAALALEMGCLLLSQFALKLRFVGRQISENTARSRMWATVLEERTK